MKKVEILEAVASNFLKTKSKSARLAAAETAMKGIDHTKPFVYCARNLNEVTCWQPGAWTDPEQFWEKVQEIYDTPEDADWYYCSQKWGVLHIDKETVMRSLDEHYKTHFKKDKEK